MITAVVLALHLLAWPPAIGAQATDPVTHLLLGLETALESGDLDSFFGTSAPALGGDDRAWLTRVVPPGGVSAAALHERSRSEAGVFVEVFLSYGTRATIASWWLTVATSESGAPRIRSITEVSRFDGLVSVALDTTRQFDVEDLRIDGPDFSVLLPSGTVFVAGNGDDGPTALVVMGRAAIAFAPPDAAEQGQLVIFDDRPTLETTADDLFVRVNPGDVGRTVSWRRMDERPVDPDALTHARAVFDERVGLSYRFDLGDLSSGEWSLEPAPDSLLVAFRTSRHGWLTYGRSPGDPEDVALFDRARLKQISLYRSADAGEADPSLDAAFDVRHTDVDLTFDPSRERLSGRASLTLSPRRALSSLTLRLADELRVSSVWSPELGPLLPLRTAGYDSLVLALPGVVEPGRLITLDVQYHGRLAPLELTQESLRVDADATVQDPSGFPDLPVTYEPRYLYSQRSWWYPQTSLPRHATASIRLTVPDSLFALATGHLVSDVVSPAMTIDGNSRERFVRTLTYRAERPVRYLSFLVARLVPVGGAEARVPVATTPTAGPAAPEAATPVAVNVMIAPGQSQPMRATPDRVASMVEFYAGVIGAAPYPSLTIAALESGLPGGHSPAYFALINQAPARTSFSWANDPVAFRDAPDFFLAHEVAHQWWGQAIGGTDYRSLWISEGFAQYFAWLYVVSTQGDDIGRRMMARMRRTSARLAREGPIDLGFRLGHLRGDRRILRSIVYNKSAVVLHMLRRLIGDEAFTAGLRRLYADSRFTAIDVDDVEAAFQAGTTVPLARFFTRWIREAGVPTLRLDWTRDTTGTGVTVTTEQHGAIFDLPYDVTVHYEDGTRETTTLRIIDGATRFPLETRGPVRRVTFDDDLTIANVIR